MYRRLELGEEVRIVGCSREDLNGLIGTVRSTNTSYKRSFLFSSRGLIIRVAMLLLVISCVANWGGLALSKAQGSDEVVSTGGGALTALLGVGVDIDAEKQQEGQRRQQVNKLALQCMHR